MIKNLSLLLFVSIFIACKKENQSSVTTGSINGTIQAFDDKLTSITDASGFIVTLSNPGMSNKSTSTDATGKFSFTDIPFDSYELSFTKTGYGTFRIFGLTHDSTTTRIPNFSLGKTSTTTVTGLSIKGNSFQGEPGVQFSYVLSPVPGPNSRAFVRYFLGTSSTVSSTNYTAVSDLINFTSLSGETGFTQRALISMGFVSGQTVWVKMYGDSWRSNDYIDPNLGMRIFPNINPTSAPAVNFVMP